MKTYRIRIDTGAEFHLDGAKLIVDDPGSKSVAYDISLVTDPEMIGDLMIPTEADEEI